MTTDTLREAMIAKVAELRAEAKLAFDKGFDDAAVDLGDDANEWQDVLDAHPPAAQVDPDDEMGGYVCLTCIDKKLEELFAHPSPPSEVERDLLRRAMDLLVTTITAMRSRCQCAKP